MAASFFSSSRLSLALTILVVLLPTYLAPLRADMQVASNMEGEKALPENLCGYKSKTYTGPCTSSTKCAYRCQIQEHASTGACHFHHLIKPRCYCYNNC